MTATAAVDRRATQFSSAAPTLLLSLGALAGATAVFKGLAPTIVPLGRFYWMFSYEYGFIRRALIGTLVHPLLNRWTFDQLATGVRTAHVVVSLVVIAGWFELFRRAVSREPSRSCSVTIALAFVVLMCSEWLPMLAHDVGYVDIYLIAFMLAGFWLVLRERYVAAGFVTFIAPLVHEAFVFLWAPVLILLVWSCLTVRTRVPARLVAAGLPALSTAAVVFLQDPGAAARAIDALPVDAGAKSGLKAYEIGQTVQSSFVEMATRQYPGNLGHVLIAAAYLLIPSAALLWAAAFCYSGRWRKPWMTMLVLVTATASPLGVLALAWDLSRFLVWANLAAAVALIAAAAPDLAG